MSYLLVIDSFFVMVKSAFEFFTPVIVFFQLWNFYLIFYCFHFFVELLILLSYFFLISFNSLPVYFTVYQTSLRKLVLFLV